MANLRPHPFGVLIRRELRELDERNSVFDLPVELLALAQDHHGSRGRSQGVDAFRKPKGDLLSTAFAA